LLRTSGGGILGHVFGDELDSRAKWLSEETHLPEGAVRMALAPMAPMAMGAIAKVAIGAITAAGAGRAAPTDHTGDHRLIRAGTPAPPAHHDHMRDVPGRDSDIVVRHVHQ